MSKTSNGTCEQCAAYYRGASELAAHVTAHRAAAAAGVAAIHATGDAQRTLRAARKAAVIFGGNHLYARDAWFAANIVAHADSFKVRTVSGAKDALKNAIAGMIAEAAV